MIITDPQEIEGLVHALNTANQIFKNAKKDKDYFILKGKFIAIKEGYECSDSVGEVKLPSTKKYHDGYKLINNITGYVKSGPDLYNYIKTFKKDINEIVIEKSYFKLSTRFGDVFESVRDSNELEYQRKLYRDYKKKIDNIITDKKKFLSYELEQDELEKFLGNRYATTLKIGKEKIIVTPKLFNSVKKTSTLSFRIFAIDTGTRLCEASLDNKDSSIVFTFAFAKI